MYRSARSFRPILEEFDKKSLLSAGQLGHLAGGVHGITDQLETKYKFYFAVKNLTGKKLGDKAVEWLLVNGNNEIEKGFAGPLSKGQEKPIATKPTVFSLATVTIKFDGGTYRNVSYISRPSTERAPTGIPVFYLNPPG